MEIPTPEVDATNVFLRKTNGCDVARADENKACTSTCDQPSQEWRFAQCRSRWLSSKPGTANPRKVGVVKVNSRFAYLL
jgi:hypothetical protein